MTVYVLRLLAESVRHTVRQNWRYLAIADTPGKMIIRQLRHGATQSHSHVDLVQVPTLDVPHGAQGKDEGLDSNRQNSVWV